MIASVVVVAAAVLLVVGLLFGAGWLGGEPEEQIVVEFSGEGDQTTEDFTVEGAWELRWEMTGGDRLEVELAGDEERMIVEREGEGSGSIYPRASGTFRFDVESDGRWSLRVFDVAD